jgi:branched-chain amino acid transport system ATP-binding protein
MSVPATPMLLEVDDLHVRYGRVEALLGVSLSVPQGSIVTVIGPNGAGKSTLLNALMGLLPTASGRIRWRGTAPPAAVEDRVGAGLALVPEKRELFSTMSVRDNLLLGAYARVRAGERGAMDDIEAVYERFPRLRERSDQLAGTLSGGERQMLAIGRALMGRPTLLMLDEPSLGLAPLVVRDIFGIIARLRESGVSILLIEQNARAALQVADHAYVIETGAVTLQGPADLLARDPRVVASYLGGH